MLLYMIVLLFVGAVVFSFILPLFVSFFRASASISSFALPKIECVYI